MDVCETEHCEDLNNVPIPVSDLTLANYAGYLAHRLKPASVKQYLNIFSILHIECNFSNPCANPWYLETTIKRIENCKGTEVQRNPPVTPEMLLNVRENLILTKSVDSIFWAACILIHSLLRKSNLFGTDAEGFHNEKRSAREVWRG